MNRTSPELPGRPGGDPAAPRDRRDLRAVAIALLAGGAVILGLGYWVGKRQAGLPSGARAPAEIVLVSPTSGDSLAGPGVTIEFRTAAQLRLTPRGWMAGPWHLHAYVDGVEHMPAAASIEALDGDGFRWRLPDVASGPRRLRLAWASEQHATLGTGASREVRFHLGGPAADAAAEAVADSLAADSSGNAHAGHR